MKEAIKRNNFKPLRKRNKQIKIYLSNEEYEMLSEVAYIKDISMSKIVRDLIIEAREELDKELYYPTI